MSAKSGGPAVGYPLMNVKFTLTAAATSEGETTEVALARPPRRRPCMTRWPKPARALLEPVMKLEVVTPEEFLGNITADLNARRAMIVNTEMRGNLVDRGRRSAAVGDVRLLDAGPQPVARPGLVFDGTAALRPRPAAGAARDARTVASRDSASRPRRGGRASPASYTPRFPREKRHGVGRSGRLQVGRTMPRNQRNLGTGCSPRQQSRMVRGPISGLAVAVSESRRGSPEAGPVRVPLTGGARSARTIRNKPGC